MSIIETTDVEKRIASKIDPAISAGMTLSTNRTGGLAFTSMSEVMEFAKMMAVSSVGVRKHLRGNVGACLAVTIQAIEWEMSPFAVANKSYSVNDQIAYEAQLINAVILRRAPIEGRFKVGYSGDDETRVCRVWVKLKESDEIVEYESPLFRKIQPKNSPLWKSDPDQQLFYYSSRALCRRHFPDVLLGVYDVDELVEDNIAPQFDDPRNVTPKSLAAELDALAGIPAHDFETGEVFEGKPGDSQSQPLVNPAIGAQRNQEIDEKMLRMKAHRAERERERDASANASASGVSRSDTDNEEPSHEAASRSESGSKGESASEPNLRPTPARASSQGNGDKGLAQPQAEPKDEAAPADQVAQREPARVSSQTDERSEAAGASSPSSASAEGAVAAERQSARAAAPTKIQLAAADAAGYTARIGGRPRRREAIIERFRDDGPLEKAFLGGYDRAKSEETTKE